MDTIDKPKKTEKPKCLKCGKSIRRWGVNKDKDWSKRKYHKSCWLNL